MISPSESKRLRQIKKPIAEINKLIEQIKKSGKEAIEGIADKICEKLDFVYAVIVDIRTASVQKKALSEAENIIMDIVKLEPMLIKKSGKNPFEKLRRLES